MYAAVIGNVEIVKLLLQSGTDEDKVNLYGNTALSIIKSSEHESTSEKKKKEILNLLQ